MPTRIPPPAPNSKDILIFQGTSMVLEVQVAGVGSIAGSAVTLMVKKRTRDADADAVIVKRVGTGITITVPGSETVPGKFEVRFAPADTTALEPSSYEYDCKMQLGSDVIQVIERSHFDIEEVITRAM